MLTKASAITREVRTDPRAGERPGSERRVRRRVGGQLLRPVQRAGASAGLSELSGIFRTRSWPRLSLSGSLMRRPFGRKRAHRLVDWGNLGTATHAV
jgi:hypothetical protein